MIVKLLALRVWRRRGGAECAQITLEEEVSLIFADSIGPMSRDLARARTGIDRGMLSDMVLGQWERELDLVARAPVLLGSFERFRYGCRSLVSHVVGRWRSAGSVVLCV